jgi:OmpA-OmpF porin, OOP family
MRNISVWVMATGLLAVSTPLLAGDSRGEAYIGVLGGVLVKPDDKHVPELDTGYGGDLRYGRVYGSGWGYEFRAFYNTLEPLDGTLDDGNRGGVGAALQYRIPAFFGVSPYLQLGVGYVYSDLIPDDPGPRAVPMGEAALGLVTVPLLRFGELGLRGRIEGRYSYEDFDQPYLDLYAFGGLELAWLRPSLPAPTPDPLRVVEVESAPAVLDSDGDGVPDDRDLCPDTPRGTPVDADGCASVEVMTLRGVNFELNSDRLRPESRAVLDEAAATLNRRYPDARVEVAGHTDSTGAASYNKALSLRRANAVRDYLIGKGIAAERLTAVGYGPDEPVADNATAAGRTENRRVELRVKEQAAAPDRRSHRLNPAVRW